MHPVSDSLIKTDFVPLCRDGCRHLYIKSYLICFLFVYIFLGIKKDCQMLILIVKSMLYLWLGYERPSHPSHAVEIGVCSRHTPFVWEPGLMSGTGSPIDGALGAFRLTGCEY